MVKKMIVLIFIIGFKDESAAVKVAAAFDQSSFAETTGTMVVPPIIFPVLLTNSTRTVKPASG